MVNRGLVVVVASVLFAVIAALAPRAASAQSLYACKPLAAGTKMQVSLKPDATLQDLSVWVTSFTCKNVVFDAGIAQTATRVTVVSSAQMTPKQAVQLFVDSLAAVGLVVVVKPDTFIVKPDPKAPPACADRDAARAAKLQSTTGAPAAGPSDAELDAGIKIVDETHVEITRALADQIAALDPDLVGKSARVVPAVKDGKPDGFKLYAIRPGSILARLGFANGDTVLTINGVSTVDEDYDKVVAAYKKAAAAKVVTFDLRRRGQPLTLTITIKDK